MSTSCPWSERAAPSGAGGPESLPAETDVLVVGGGLAGVAVARCLAEGGARVTVIEAGPDLGAGGSGRGAGQVLTGLVEHPYRVAAALGDERARALYAFSRRAGDLVAGWVPMRRDGQHWVALERREHDQIRQSAAALTRLGVPAALASGAPGVAVDGPSLRVDGDGVVEPVAAIRAIAAGAAAAGATLIAGARVEAVDDDPLGLRVRVAGRDVRAEVVVFAGGHTLAALDPWFGDKLTPVREQALLTAPIAAAYPGAGRAGFGYTFWRQLPGGELLVGGARWAVSTLEVGETVPAIDDRIQARLEGFLRKHLGAGEAPITHRWSWIDTHTCDQLPVVGPLPGSPRRIALTGFCGNDWGLAPAAARAVADGLLAEGQPDVPSQLAATRFVG